MKIFDYLKRTSDISNGARISAIIGVVGLMVINDYCINKCTKAEIEKIELEEKYKSLKEEIEEKERILNKIDEV